MPETSSYGPAPVLEIIREGYQKLFQSIIPMTKLGLPFILLGGLTSGFIFPDISAFQVHHHHLAFQELMKLLTGSGIMIFVSFVMAYLYYVFLRYIRDVYRSAVHENLYEYLMPAKDFWGLIGILLLSILFSVPVLVVILIGFLLLLIPGIICVTYFSTWLMMLYVTYIQDSDAGILEAIRENLGLFKDAFWRTIGLGLIVGFIKVGIELPFSFLLQIFNWMIKFNPGLGQNYSLPVLFAVFFTVMYWVHFVLGVGGLLFVLNRYYWDLKTRSASDVDSGASGTT